MQNAQFIQANPANRQAIDCEDFAEAVQFDELCQANWPIWVAFRNDQPVGWFNECEDVAFIG